MQTQITVAAKISCADAGYLVISISTFIPCQNHGTQSLPATANKFEVATTRNSSPPAGNLSRLPYNTWFKLYISHISSQSTAIRDLPRLIYCDRSVRTLFFTWLTISRLRPGPPHFCYMLYLERSQVNAAFGRVFFTGIVGSSRGFLDLHEVAW